MASGRVAVVVPVHNRGERLHRLVAALEAQLRAPDAVVFVDDASTDTTPEVLEAAKAASSLRINVIRLPENRGPAVARNVGWQSVPDAEFVAFTDDDCIPSPGWLAAGLDMLANDEGVGVVQGRTVPDPAVRRRNWDRTRQVLEPSPFFEACNLMFRRAAVEAAGGFDERLRMGGEDTALGWGVLALGWRRSFSEAAVVQHDVTPPDFRWYIRETWKARNLIAVAREFPELRDSFWRRWAFRREEALFAGVYAAAAVAPFQPLGAVLAVPYVVDNLWQARTRHPTWEWFRARFGVAALDATAVASMLVGSIRYRVFVI